MYSDAINDFNETIKLDSNYALAYNNLANCLRLIKRYKEAIPYLTKAIQLDLHTESLYYRAICYNEIGKYKESLADLNKIIKLEPSDNEAINLKKIVTSQLKK